MTERLRELFDDVVADEPAPTVTVDELVRAGRGEVRRRQRRRQVVLGAAAAIVLVIAGLVVRGMGGGDQELITQSGPRPTTSQPTTTDRPPEGETTTSTTATPQTTASSTTATTTAPATSSPPSTSSPPAQELLTDPGFEASPPDWSVFGSSTELRPVTDAPRTRRQALAVVTTATGPDRVVAGATNTSLVLRTVPGARYTATCWARSDEPIRARVQLQEYTVDWQRAGDPTPSAPVTLTDPTRWYQVSVTHTATGTGNQLPLSVFTTDLFAPNPPLVIDDCHLTAN